jgi:sortase A
MRNKTLAVPICFPIVVVSIVWLFLLIGCVPTTSDVKGVATPTLPSNENARQANGIDAHTTLNLITPTLSQHPSPTPLPPTPRPVKPTAIQKPTRVPVANSPTPIQHFAPIRLIIPVINLDVPIVAMGWSVVNNRGQQVSEWDVPNWRAAGWLNFSALVGERGNTVLEGHQDIDGRVFENLDQLKGGDEIQVQAGSEIHKYVVVVRTIVPEKNQPPEVRRENARWIARSNDERLTLVTCWPRNDNTHRLILVALPTH